MNHYNSMFNFFNMPYDKPILICKNSITRQRICLEKSRFTQCDTDQYFIKILQTTPNGNYLCQGYIYFYLDFLMRSSDFIGMYIKPDARNLGLAQLLISYWIGICLDNGIYDLKTIPKQRKPFILYLLKKFKFDLNDTSKYQTYPNVISICHDEFINGKCLYFQNPKQSATFRCGKINAGDNYVILDELTSNTVVLDKVILSTPYESTDESVMCTKSHKLIRSFQERQN